MARAIGLANVCVVAGLAEAGAASRRFGERAGVDAPGYKAGDATPSSRPSHENATIASRLQNTARSKGPFFA